MAGLSFDKPEDMFEGDFRGSKNMYTRESIPEEVSLDDFICLKIVGKGTFGKVFLVVNKKTEKLYAMKSIRKDIVIDNDSIENIKLERLILLQVNHPFIISMDYVF